MGQVQEVLAWSERRTSKEKVVKPHVQEGGMFPLADLAMEFVMVLNIDSPVVGVCLIDYLVGAFG